MKNDAKSEKKVAVKKTTSKKMTAKKSATKKSKAKKKNEVEDMTFEERAFANDKKVKKVKKDSKKTNVVPIVVGLLCVAVVIGVVFVSKNKNFSLMETKKMELKESVETTIVTEVPTTEPTTEALKIKASTATLQKVLPYYDSDIYSEGALYSYDKDTLLSAKDEVEALQNDEAYIQTVDEGKKDVLSNNKLILDNYLGKYSLDVKGEYDNAAKRDYMDDIINGAKEKKGGFYHSDFIAVSLFSEAKDKGFYYAVPSSLYKKVTIKKYAFDKMNVGDKGSISLPIRENGSLVSTEVIKQDDNRVSFVDANGDTKMLRLAEKSDLEYALINEETGAYVAVQYLNKDISILKNARIGHGKNMEYIAYNYLKYPTELNFEVYVLAEDIVNKTSSNNMLNGQFINSSKQIWDEKGFVVSLVFFEN